MTAAALAFDHIESEGLSPLLGSPLRVLDLADRDASALAAALRTTQAVVCGIDRAGTCPVVDTASFDLILTASLAAPAPWVSVPMARIGDRLAAISRTAAGSPHATAILAQVLRIGEALPLGQALLVESLAYSTLLGGAEFRRWRARTPVLPVARSRGVLIDRQDGELTVTLASPATRNAIDAHMRDALHAALAAALDDPSEPSLLLRGAGACFSVGGALGEFGTATDLAAAHGVRTLRSCAQALAELGGRATVLLHGACVGSGIEIPAAVVNRRALADAWFQLPELGMGLIPGAGGTATLPRAIGRHRTAYMALTRRRIGAEEACAWGLVQSIDGPS